MLRSTLFKVTAAALYASSFNAQSTITNVHFEELHNSANLTVGPYILVIPGNYNVCMGPTDKCNQQRLRNLAFGEICENGGYLATFA